MSSDMLRQGWIYTGNHIIRLASQAHNVRSTHSSTLKLLPHGKHQLFLNQIFSHIDRAGGKNDDTLDDVLHIRVDTEKGKADEDYAQEDDAENNAAYLADTADEGDTADNSGGDCVKLVVKTR